MMTRKKIVVGLSALGLLAAAAPSLATPTLSFTDETYGAFVLDPFGGFDWNSAGSAVTTGFIPDGTTVFTTEYWANAVSVQTPGGAILGAPLATNPIFANGVEFTINAIIKETATPIDATTSQFTTAFGGTWEIFFDPTPDSNIVTGAGITGGGDSILILSGTITANRVAGNFNNNPSDGGTGDFDFTGLVTYTNPTYIVPDLTTTLAGAEIRFGVSTTAYTTATGVPGPNGTSENLPEGALIFQADGNQSFAVPTPGTLGLLSLGLLGLTGLSRRLRRS
jgi:hypothetical protein